MVNQVIARYLYYGKSFEILLDSDKLKEYKTGRLTSISDVIITQAVFRNIRIAKKVDNKMLMQDREGSAERYDEKILLEVFKTTDIESIAKIIIEKGEIQYTTEQRNEMLEKKRKKIISIISSQAIDPRMGIPYTYERIENAIKQTKIRIDVNERAESQISRIMDTLKPLIPITIEQIEIDIKVPITFAGRVRPELERRATIFNESWTSSDWICRIRLYAGMKSDIYDMLNRLTKGQVITDEIK